MGRVGVPSGGYRIFTLFKAGMAVCEKPLLERAL
jgi:hypothetical protein